MRFKTEGIIISIKELQEDGAVVQCVTQNVGMLSGFVAKINSKRMKGTVAVGNLVSINYYGRERTLGRMMPELVTSYTGGCMSDRLRLFMVLCVCEMAHFLWGKQHGHHHEPDDESPIGSVYSSMKAFFEQCLTMEDPLLNSFLVSQFVIMMKILLTESGYGFSLSHCVATGETDLQELKFISPKSWSAVSKKAAAMYPNVFLKMPTFFVTHEVDHDVPPDDLRDGMAIVDRFFSKISSAYFSQKVPDLWVKTRDIVLSQISE